jgi:hypothetical protein
MSYFKDDDDDDDDNYNDSFMKLHRNCEYCDIDDIHSDSCCLVNIINSDLSCEKCLAELNCHMFQLPGYHFICNNRNSDRGGVAMYIRDNFQFSIRTVLTVNDILEFETIFAEITQGMHRLVIGEVHIVFNTNEEGSINRY